MDAVRLSCAEIDILKESILQVDSKAKIYLFGSRVDLDRSGGDIDILILSDLMRLKDLRDIRLRFFKEFGEQKLDIVLDTHSVSKAFTKIIQQKVVQL